jgi:hypothetical protein
LDRDERSLANVVWQSILWLSGTTLITMKETHVDLGRRVSQELGLPVDAPNALAEGTMRNGTERVCELDGEFTRDTLEGARSQQVS